ncbi:MAG: hypothetical protein HKN50_11995 [Gammaproteobacteria bacterium]|nr:hypothetical protein [Gammaproteobacteria bacterium]
MDRIVRAFPVSSKEALMAMAEGVDKFSCDERKCFFDNFNGAVEDWYFQEIEGKPYVIAIVEGENLEQGFDNYAALQDEFSVWFKSQVKSLTGYDLSETPKGPTCEQVYRFHA